MAKSTQKVTPADTASTGVEVQDLVEANGEAMALVMRSGQAMIAGMSSLGSEMMAFGSTRLKENIETAESLGHCRNPEDVFQLQCDYAHKVAQQYAEEVTRMVQLATRMTQATWTPIEDRTKETLRGLGGE